MFENDNEIGYAIWYPQMGGYVGKATVVIRKNEVGNTCFEAYVWHDGEFPFDEGRVPAELHHCEAEQFIHFGNEVNELMTATGVRK